MTWAGDYEQEPDDVERKRFIGNILMLMDNIWKWVGARHGLQETEEIGAGFEGWYWTNSVSRVGTMNVC